jgi:hypothetical protein
MAAALLVTSTTLVMTATATLPMTTAMPVMTASTVMTTASTAVIGIRTSVIPGIRITVRGIGIIEVQARSAIPVWIRGSVVRVGVGIGWVDGVRIPVVIPIGVGIQETARNQQQRRSKNELFHDPPPGVVFYFNLLCKV